MAKKPEKLIFKGGAASTKIPRFELNLREAQARLAARSALGLERHPEGAWNPLTKNQEVLEDVEWITARLAHVIDHAYKAIEKLHGLMPEDGEDDAAAMMWGGQLLVAHQEWMKKKDAQKTSTASPEK